MKNILVTGGAGFIGSNFIKYLLKQEKDIAIINLDLLTYAGSLNNLRDIENDKRYTFIQGNIANKELVDLIFRWFKIDTVVHFAAETHVDRSVLSPDIFMKTNVLGTFVLLEVARYHWMIKHTVPLKQALFHHISTDEVFGTLTLNNPPFNEHTPYKPRSPYASSKASSDHIVRSYFSTYGLPITITNCSNNYGAYQFPEKLIPLIILNATSGKKLPIYGDGLQIRDWLYVEDHCEAIYKVIKNRIVGETYCIGGGNQLTNLKIVNMVCRILNKKFPNSNLVPYNHLIKHVKDRPGHDFRYDIDYSKIKNNLGWQPHHSLEAGLEKTVDWYLNNEKWLNHIKKKSNYTTWIKDNYIKRMSS